MVAACVVVASCSSAEPTPQPTTFPLAGPDAAASVAEAYLAAWSAGDHEAMYELIDPEQRERYPFERFRDLHAALAEMTEADAVSATATGATRRVRAATRGAAGPVPGAHRHADADAGPIGQP